MYCKPFQEVSAVNTGVPCPKVPIHRKLGKQQKIAFQSITENINTATATGQLVFHLFGALAEFERNLITERTMAGLQAARARGRKGGRPKLNPAVSKVAMAKKLYADQTNSIRDICRTLHISRATLYRYIK
jgi:DNA invertase Pin-like site-specific DNA recombinase